MILGEPWRGRGRGRGSGESGGRKEGRKVLPASKFTCIRAVVNCELDTGYRGERGPSTSGTCWYVSCCMHIFNQATSQLRGNTGS